MRYFKIDEERLLELLENEARFQCLEYDGVDNWEWYMESRIQFIADALEITKEEVEKRDLDFDDLAKIELTEFKEV